jgi:putative membrane protein
MRTFLANGRRLAALLAAVLLAAGGATTGPSVIGSPYNDADIVAITMASNDGEILTSEPALEKATAPAVRDFAQLMVHDHTAANEQLRHVGVEPQENDLSRQLTGSAAETVQALATYSGAQYDRAYMDAQIAMHRYTLNALDNTLIPAARRRHLINTLKQIRETVASHLEQAEQVRAGL